MLHFARLAQVQLGLALLALIICVVALAVRNVFGRAPAPDFVRAWQAARDQPRDRELTGVRGLLVGAWRVIDRPLIWVMNAIIGLWPREQPRVPERWRTRGRWALDGGLALIALLLALFSLTAPGLRGQKLDRERVLHEAVQAKYHGELGWDRLYACAWAADRDAEQAIGGVELLRVLTLGPAPTLEPEIEAERRIDMSGERPRKISIPGTRVTPERPPPDVGGRLWPAPAAAAQLDCRQYFDDARWAALGADLAALGAMDPSQSMAGTLRGFGSTATPSRLARQRLLFSVVPISGPTMFVLTLLSGLLVIGALVLVHLAYGLRAAALIGIVCFVEFGASQVAGGPSAANWLVLAAILAGCAAWELERFALAGGLLAFAAVELIWPTLFVVALLLALLAGRVAEHERELARFGIGVAGTAAALLLLCATLPGGLANWSQWLDRVAVHRYADGSYEVGLRWLFAPDGSWLGGPREVPYPLKAQHLVDRHDWIVLCGLALLTPVLLAVRRLPPVAFMAIAGVTATFTLMSTHASSWGLALPALALAAAAVAKHDESSTLLVGRPTTVLVAGILALCVAMHGMVRIHHFAPWLFNMIYSHLLTTLLLGLGVALVLLPGLRERGDPPGAPASTPVLEPGSGRAKREPEPKPEEPPP